MDQAVLKSVLPMLSLTPGCFIGIYLGTLSMCVAIYIGFLRLLRVVALVDYAVRWCVGRGRAMLFWVYDQLWSHDRSERRASATVRGRMFRVAASPAVAQGAQRDAELGDLRKMTSTGIMSTAVN